MKKIWKVLGIGALAASLIPYATETDEETGEKTVSALLWRLRRGPDEEAEGKERIELDLGPRFLRARKEAEMFADDEPEAAMVAGAAAGAQAVMETGEEPEIGPKDCETEA